MPSADFTALTGNWKALLICPNRSVTQELLPLLTEQLPRMPVFEMQDYPVRQVVAELSGSQAPNICFLDLTADRERALSLIGELLAVEARIRIVVLLASKDPNLILRAMRQGAVEFLVRPFTAEQIESVAERLAALHLNGGNGSGLGKVYAVIPAKGACGASTIACNLGPLHKRYGQKRILLADLDPLTGTQSFLLKLKSTYSFLDALARSHSLDGDLWKGMVASAAGLDVLPAPETVKEGVQDLRDCSAIIEFARTQYETTVLDAASVYGDWNLAQARLCDDLLLITTNELPALQATQRAMGYLEHNGVNLNKVRLVVNRYSKEHGLSRDVIETALHCEVFHVIPTDTDSVQRALIEGKPIPANTTFGKSLAQLADKLSGKPAQQAAEPKKSGGLAGLVSSLFSR